MHASQQLHGLHVHDIPTFIVNSISIALSHVSMGHVLTTKFELLHVVGSHVMHVVHAVMECSILLIHLLLNVYM